jgi:hypothetical protein
MKFRKKPVVIEAVQYTDEMRRTGQLPDGVVIVPFRDGPNGADDYACIHTLEGDMIVGPGDWVITGVKGERYPCKPDIFAATYEPVEGFADDGSGDVMADPHAPLDELAEKWSDAADWEYINGDRGFASGLDQCASELKTLYQCASELKTLLAALAPPSVASPIASAWQPIETAPKDGTQIVALHEEGIDLCHWEEAHPDGVDDMGHDAGWFGLAYAAPGRSFGNPRYVRAPQGQPRHWMPLPDPPASPIASEQTNDDDVTRIGQLDADPPPQHAAENEKA